MEDIMLDNAERYVENLDKMDGQLLQMIVPDLLRQGLIAVEEESVEEASRYGVSECGYVLENLWVNRGTNSTALWEFAEHKKRGYTILAKHFSRGEEISGEEYYEAYQNAMQTATKNTDRKYLFTFYEKE